MKSTIKSFLQIKRLRFILVVSTILATTPAISYGQDCETPEVIDAAKYTLVCGGSPNPKDQALQNLSKLGGCATYAKEFGATTWAGMSAVTQQQETNFVDAVMIPMMRKEVADVPDNAAKEAFIAGETKLATTTAIVTMVHSMLSFTPTTVQYDPSTNRYLCRSRIVYAPNFVKQAVYFEFLLIALRGNLAAYKQEMRNNNTQIMDRINKDVTALMLATAPMLMMNPTYCDTKTYEYITQRIPSGKIIITGNSIKCGG